MSAIATRLLSPVLLFVTLCTPVVTFAAQAPANSVTLASAPPPRTPSSILQPALENLKQTIGAVRLDKWKTSNIIRDETDANLASIRRDLDATLPALLVTADAAPNSVSSMLPAFRNVEALYDVLLRVAQVGKLSATSQQSTALDQAIASLDEARRTFGDRLQSAALAQERQVADLQAALRAVPPPPPPASATAPPAPVQKKRKPKATIKPAPTTTQGSSTP